MKLLILATISATALIATSQATTTMQFYTDENFKGKCSQFQITAYDKCFNVSKAKNAKSLKFVNDDPAASDLTFTFFSSTNCGGKWIRDGRAVPYGEVLEGAKIPWVYGNVGSFMLQKGKLTLEKGKNNNKLPSTPAKFNKKCTY
ncbi:hypothetical protein BX616_009741 [Lobosporangium transversale]|nr:hypothetical protein BX616_009741 [Lobosporangium transversale]